MKYYCHPPKDHKEHERERINTTGSVTKIQILGSCEIGLLVSCKSRTGIQGVSISSPSSGSPCSYQHILQSYNHSDVPTIPKIHKKPHYCRSQHGHSHTQSSHERWPSNLGDISPPLMLRPSPPAMSGSHSSLNYPRTRLHRCFSERKQECQWHHGGLFQSKQVHP